MRRTLRRTSSTGAVVLATLAVPAMRDLAGTPLPIHRFRAAPSGFAAYSGIVDSLRVVVDDAARWAMYWRRLHAGAMPVPPVPPVDFARDMVILAALGTRSSGGFTIRIDSAYDDGASVEIVVSRTSPGRGCVLTAALTQPVDIVRIPARKVPVRFRELDVTEPCD